ncbi:hypothetical protein LGM68_00355 [Xanthomonas citri pv. malvacearum]|uniref:hypothetical protein n=1 Tax=Xanthomonas citri TaxID=346 RepID=UPI0022AF3F0C|nr:hypothetical protein [Xanthomonas citri]WAW95464.1 hypothetical protein LGM68_00355 [Xanthomonas citri pv. malvacearum]
MIAAQRMRAGFVAGAVLYALGQGCALLFQWLLLRRFGLQGYGDVGLAHLGLVTVLFLADLGYASLFLREDPAAPGWNARWRQALWHRLLATLVLDLLWIAGVWWSGRGHGEGFRYLLAVLSATVFGLVGYSAPLLARGRMLAGFIVQQVAMPATILAWFVLQQLPGWNGGLGAGLAVSLGYLLQALVNIAVFGAPLQLLWPRRGGGRRMLRPALQLSLLSIAGTLHDRLTPLLLASVAPAFLPVYLFLNYLLNGASGVFNQFNRLLVADARGPTGEHWAGALVSLVLGAAAVGALALLVVAAAWGSAEQRAWLPWVTPVLAAGATTLLSSVLAALLIGRHREATMVPLLLGGALCSALLQVAAAAAHAPQWMLWLRFLCVLAMAAASLHLCGLRLNAGGYAALLSAVLAVSLGGGPVTMTLAALLLVPVAWTVWQRRSLLHTTLSARA